MDEQLEKAIDEVGRERVFGLVRSIGWSGCSSEKCCCYGADAFECKGGLEIREIVSRLLTDLKAAGFVIVPKEEITWTGNGYSQEQIDEIVSTASQKE